MTFKEICTVTLLTLMYILYYILEHGKCLGWNLVR